MRTGLTRRGSALVTSIDLEEGSSRSVVEQLRAILSKQAVRVIDLFREWDEDGDGKRSLRTARDGWRPLRDPAPALPLRLPLTLTGPGPSSCLKPVSLALRTAREPTPNQASSPRRNSARRCPCSASLRPRHRWTSCSTPSTRTAAALSASTS